ncbi:hypothetical protein F5887DRAFT_995123 [Amanita rubescens]|nr:hypothetical protein F5887DRAFT_995123 [Amanita rubescens]
MLPCHIHDSSCEYKDWLILIMSSSGPSARFCKAMILYISSLALALAPAVLAQSPEHTNIAVCTDDNFTWAFNSLGQSPCYVAWAVTPPCAPPLDELYPPPLPSGYTYAGLSSDQANNCTCNSITYSLICACGACQDGNCVSWSNYTQHCNQTWLMQYPETIQNDTSIPHWAYLDVSIDNGFNVTAAASASGPDSTAPPPATSTLSTSTPMSASASTSTSSSASASASTSTSNSSYSSKTSIGAVAGGIVGGIVGMGLIVALVFWVHMRHKSQRVVQASARMSVQEILPSPLPDVNPPPMQSVHPLPYKLYNPNDPSTFPSLRNQFTQMRTESATYAVESRQQYTGMPEP